MKGRVALQAPGPHAEWRSEFSFVAGGPFHRLLRRARILDRDVPDVVRSSLAVATVALAPVLLLAALQRARGGGLDPLLCDFSVFARYLAAIPLFFAGEYGLHVRCTRTVERFMQGGFPGEEGVAAVERALQRAQRLRDLRSVELGIAVAAVLGGQASLWQVAGSAGWLHGASAPAGVSPAQLWYGFVALPLFQFLIARWLWRWLIWSRWLFDVSRLQLRLVPTHPDRAGGIGLLADPSYAYTAFAAGASTVIAATWATRLSSHGVQLAAFTLPAAVLGLLTLTLAFAPLLVFIPTMIRKRFTALREYGRLATVHARLFHGRWLEREIDDSILGSQDISSLADLQTAYLEMTRMRPVPFGHRPMLAVAAAVIGPMVPLLTFEIPLTELLLKLGRSLLLGPLE
jgi:hypothetical protein